jgi:hypothetical protein
MRITKLVAGIACIFLVCLSCAGIILFPPTPVEHVENQPAEPAELDPIASLFGFVAVAGMLGLLVTGIALIILSFVPTRRDE